MNTLHWILGACAGALGIAQIVPYVVSILHGHTKPSRISQALSLVIGTMTFASMASIGAGAGAVLPAAFLLGNVIVMVLAIKHGADAKSKIKYFICLCALLAIVLWIIEGPHWAIAMAAIANFASYVEVWTKQKAYPDSENLTSWLLAIGASIFSLSALLVMPLPHWIVVVPSCLTICCGTLVVLIGWRQRRAMTGH